MLVSTISNSFYKRDNKIKQIICSQASSFAQQVSHVNSIVSFFLISFVVKEEERKAAPQDSTKAMHCFANLSFWMTPR